MTMAVRNKWRNERAYWQGRWLDYNLWFHKEAEKQRMIQLRERIEAEKQRMIQLRERIEERKEKERQLRRTKRKEEGGARQAMIRRALQFDMRRQNDQNAQAREEREREKACNLTEARKRWNREF